MIKYEMAWCQECKRWVPFQRMNYFDGHRVCQYCLDGTSTPESYIHDPYHDKVQCIFCDSYVTVELIPNWGTFKCNSCGEIFTI